MHTTTSRALQHIIIYFLLLTFSYLLVLVENGGNSTYGIIRTRLGKSQKGYYFKMWAHTRIRSGLAWRDNQIHVVCLLISGLLHNYSYKHEINLKLSVISLYIILFTRRYRILSMMNNEPCKESKKSCKLK